MFRRAARQQAKVGSSHGLLPYWRFVLKIMGGIALVYSVWVGWQYMMSPFNYPVRHVAVEGTFAHLGYEELQMVITPIVSRGFFNFSVNQLRQSIVTIPWVADVSVKRLWPDKVIVKIQEQIAYATWNNQALLNSQGELFYPDKKTYPEDIPELIGPQDQLQMILSNYNRINEMLQAFGVTLKKLEVSSRGAWQMVLSNQIQVMMGREDLWKRVKRFINVYPKVFDQGNIANLVDFRYPNGMAVKW